MKLPHIIFLDFDGPLFPGRALLMPENNGAASEILKELYLHPVISYWKADPMAVAMLQALYKIRTFHLVISSSWADESIHNKEQIERLLKINDITIPLHKDWRTPREHGVTEKSNEIAQWLSNNINRYSDYLILDDYDSGDGLLDNKHLKKIKIKTENVMLVDFEEGITMKDYYKMQEILRNWK